MARESGRSPMNAVEFEEVALALIGSGHSPIPIMPGSKSPGERIRDGCWRSMSRWQKWCHEQVPPTRVEAWLRMIGTADDAGIGVALGRGLICIDIDQEYLLDPVLAILPPSPVQKKGRKGVSLFYRGDTEKIRSRKNRTPERVGLLDLLAEGTQTVPEGIAADLARLAAKMKAELPEVWAALGELAADQSFLRERAKERIEAREACRKMNAVESKKLLTEYDIAAAKIGDILARLKEISDETTSVNEALHANPVADSVLCRDTLYRKNPDRETTDRISFRAGYYKVPLSGIHLPPAFAGGKGHWPRP